MSDIINCTIPLSLQVLWCLVLLVWSSSGVTKHLTNVNGFIVLCRGSWLVATDIQVVMKQFEYVSEEASEYGAACLQVMACPCHECIEDSLLIRNIYVITG